MLFRVRLSVHSIVKLLLPLFFRSLHQVVYNAPVEKWMLSLGWRLTNGLACILTVATEGLLYS
jgi:hypothetical protein